MNDCVENRKPPLKCYNCKPCDYVTVRKHDFRKHIETIKHQIKTSSCQNGVGMGIGIGGIGGISGIDISSIGGGDKCFKQHSCACGKSYKHHSSLHTHKNKCDVFLKSKEENGTGGSSTFMDASSSVADIIQQNNEFKELIIEQHKQLMHQNQTILEFATKANMQTTTVNNNTFNLHLFLNIDCKDALSMEDFLKTVVVQLKDLENAQIAGYSDGISSIIVKALRALEINKRPIHCSDLKRKTMYIKEGGEWSKENEDNKRMKDMIRNVEHKTIKKIPDWVKEHPYCVKGTHKDSTQYLQMVEQVSGGDLQKGEENINKIINNIAKEVVIVK